MRPSPYLKAFSFGHFLEFFGRQLPTTPAPLVAWQPKHSPQFLHTLPGLQTILPMILKVLLTSEHEYWVQCF